MVYIQIIYLPQGEAPLEIRKSWIGCSFPADGPIQLETREVVSGVARHAMGYGVRATVAIASLRHNNHLSAATWWEKLYGEAVSGEGLFFNADECLVIAHLD